MAMQMGPGVPTEVNSEQIKPFKEFLLSYNRLSEICFTDCINDFTTRNIKDKEDKCALNCMEKYLKMTQRVAQRFQEFQMVVQENAIAQAKKEGQLT